MPSPRETDCTHYRSHLLASLVAFLAEHRRCGEMDSAGLGNGSGWPVRVGRSSVGRWRRSSPRAPT